MRAIHNLALIWGLHGRRFVILNSAELCGSVPCYIYDKQYECARMHNKDAFYDNRSVEYMNIALRNTGLWPMGARTLTSSTARSRYTGVPIASSPRNVISEELTRSAYPVVVPRRAGAR